MFERFTPRSRRVLVVGQEEARKLGHGEIGTEHLLLGLAAEGEGLAAVALGSVGFDLDWARRDAGDLRPRTDSPPANPPFNRQAKAALESSLQAALDLGHNYIGTEHLLLGLLRDPASGAGRVLDAQAIAAEPARDAVLTLLRPPPQEPGGPLGLAGPRCPKCRGSLSETLTYRQMNVPADGNDDGQVSVLVLWCRSCGYALGTAAVPATR